MIPPELQKLRCRVNFQALKFTPKIESLGQKLVHVLQERGPYVALHLRYEMDMLAFSGCTHGCTQEESDQLKRLRCVVCMQIPRFLVYRISATNFQGKTEEH